MNRSAALCLLLAAAILDLAAAQAVTTAPSTNSSWNPTDLEDALFLGLVIGGSVLLLLMILIITLCCCCFMCPQLFEPCGCNFCGPPQEEPYFEPPPPQYYPQEPPPPPQDPSPYPIVIQAPQRPREEPVFIMRDEPRQREQRVIYVRRSNSYGEDDYNDRRDRRVVIARSRSSYGDYDRGDRGRYADDYSRPSYRRSDPSTDVQRYSFGGGNDNKGYYY